MNKNNLQDLAKIANAKVSAEASLLSAITAEERELRRKLADLDNHQTRMRDIADERITTMRAIGADVLWQGWIARSRRHLHIRLAQVLARKSQAIAAYQAVCGQQTAINDLIERERRHRHQEKARADQDAQQFLNILKSAV